MRRWVILAVAASLCSPGYAFAQWSPNPDAPIGISLDGADAQGFIDPSSCTGTLKGQIEVTQDQMRLRARSLVSYQAKRQSGCGGIYRMVADGEVYYVTPNETVRANHAVYDLTADKVTFTGDVVITRGVDVATSQSLTVSLKSGAATLSGRVRAVFYPERKAESPAK